MTRGDAGAWVELAVVADPEAVEAVSEILSRVASGGTSVEPAFELVDEGLGARVDPTRPATVRAYLPARDPGEVAATLDRVRRDLGHLQAFGLRPIGELESRLLDEADWAEAWKAHFPVLRVGRRLVVRPTWRRHRRAADEVVLALDPGMAFGTGLHPTTRLCLAMLESLADRGVLAVGEAAADEAATEGGAVGEAPTRGPASHTAARVLDVGCGSGILAIAALKLGAGEAMGIDTDPIAIEATLSNGHRNRLSRRLHARRGTLPSGAGPFDVVLANLIASLLVELAAALRDELRPAGTLVASGIFVDREAEVAEAFAAAGLAVSGRTVEGDWVALQATRTG